MKTLITPAQVLATAFGDGETLPPSTVAAADIAAACEAAFGEPVPASLIRPLGILVESGLTRRACGLVVQNPNELAVKYDSMDGMCLLSSVLPCLPSLREADLFSPDSTGEPTATAR